MTGADLTIAIAVAAGLISFLSPCVLPLVPAYLGQLTAVAVAGNASGARPSRWLAVRHAIAFVLGFGAVFTVIGITATYAASGLSPYLSTLRQVGGLVLIVMVLSLAGILRIPVLERTWRPLDAGAMGSMATATGSIALAPAGGSGGSRGPGGSVAPGEAGFGHRLGGRMVSERGGLAAAFGLGSIFAVGWTPCIGIILGGILTLAATSTTVAQGGVLLVAYTLGLGLPFIAIAAVYDRAPGLLRPLVRHGRAVTLVGGLLVVAIGVAMVMDWLALLPRYVPFNTAV